MRAVAIDTDVLIVEDLKVVAARAQGGKPKAGGIGGPKYQPTNSWTRGVQFVMAGGAMGTLAAINEEVERSHVATISLIFFVIFVLHSITYQSMASGGIIFLQIATATMLSLAYMAIRGIGLNINTLPVQAVGVGIGVDYAIYIVDRIRQEVAETADIDEAIRRAIRTTGMAVTFTATTVVGGIVFWTLSNLRFQAEMAYLLVILMIINMLGAITVVPTFYSILRPSVATALLTDEQREAIRLQKELESKRDQRRGIATRTAIGGSARAKSKLARSPSPVCRSAERALAQRGGPTGSDERWSVFATARSARGSTPQAQQRPKPRLRVPDGDERHEHQVRGDQQEVAAKGAAVFRLGFGDGFHRVILRKSSARAIGARDPNRLVAQD